MKKILSLFALAGTLACTTPASAEVVFASVTSSVPNAWTEVVTTVPVDVCNIQRIPIYYEVRGKGATGLEVLGGAIIGGLIGKGITDKDEGAVVGGILGGVAAAEVNP